MPVDAVNGKNNNYLVPGIATGAVAGGVTSYYTWKKPVNAKYLSGLTEDKFEKVFEKLPEDKQGVGDIISAILKERKELDPLKDLTVTDGKIEVSDVLEQFNKNISSQAGLNELKESLTNLGVKIPEEFTKAEDLDSIINLLNTKDADVDKNSKEIADVCKKSLTSLKEMLMSAKDGKIDAEAYKALSIKGANESTDIAINGILKELGKDVPKMKSWKNAGIGAAIGAAVLGTIGYFVKTKPAKAEEKAEAAKA